MISYELVEILLFGGIAIILILVVAVIVFITFTKVD